MLGDPSAKFVHFSSGYQSFILKLRNSHLATDSQGGLIPDGKGCVLKTSLYSKMPVHELGELAMIGVA